MFEVFGDRLFNGLERMSPAAGMLLVAAPGMPSPDFARSVILIVEHDFQGTFGVALTERSDTAVHSVMPEWVDLIAKPQAVYVGGPVDPQAVVGLAVTRPEVDIAEHPELNRLANRLVHVDLNSTPASMAELLQGMRLFAGYCSWAPGQLNAEIERGDWFVTPALPSDVTAAGSVDLWGDVMRRQSQPLPLFATFPASIVES
ncbi:YqgE/AlgH family protein [Corynebacterium uropygiale]|uniref:YqgE/AlgH family protein n=1 Tax=Corynebacterium uropygiale TaxID=1775911 RepID=A0A9X1U047_9CORY|nr:YqgE/AlgH family protein [Corynebacterium uropygiale]